MNSFFSLQSLEGVSSVSIDFGKDFVGKGLNGS